MGCQVPGTYAAPLPETWRNRRAARLWTLRRTRRHLPVANTGTASRRPTHPASRGTRDPPTEPSPGTHPEQLPDTRAARFSLKRGTPADDLYYAPVLAGNQALTMGETEGRPRGARRRSARSAGTAERASEASGRHCGGAEVWSVRQRDRASSDRSSPRTEHGGLCGPIRGPGSSPGLCPWSMPPQAAAGRPEPRPGPYGTCQRGNHGARYHTPATIRRRPEGMARHGQVTSQRRAHASPGVTGFSWEECLGPRGSERGVRPAIWAAAPVDGEPSLLRPATAGLSSQRTARRLPSRRKSRT